MSRRAFRNIRSTHLTSSHYVNASAVIIAKARQTQGMALWLILNTPCTMFAISDLICVSSWGSLHLWCVFGSNNSRALAKLAPPTLSSCYVPVVIATIADWGNEYATSLNPDVTSNLSRSITSNKAASTSLLPGV
mmetsp:Transcript_30662/g.50987  ORF Transcript_30662/g.50987 Transcript_30662/m.50987 type:complete len:135 (-) Transcript_30662:323-727(-)